MYAVIALIVALVGGRIVLNAVSTVEQVPSHNDDLAWW